MHNKEFGRSTTRRSAMMRFLRSTHHARIETHPIKRAKATANQESITFIIRVGPTDLSVYCWTARRWLEGVWGLPYRSTRTRSPEVQETFSIGLAFRHIVTYYVSLGG